MMGYLKIPVFLDRTTRLFFRNIVFLDWVALFSSFRFSGQSQCSLYQKQVPEGDSTLHAHPFVAFAEKRTRFAQRSKAFGQAVVVSKILNTVMVLSVVLCDCCKPMNDCRDWAFSNSGLEVGLPAFQLPITELWSPRFVTYICALSCAIRLLQIKERLSRLSF